MKEKKSVDDMDSTQDLLDSTLPNTPELVDSVLQDSDEDEIFFGSKTAKETSAPYAKSSRRDTICLTDVETSRRRSFKPAGRRKSREILLSQPVLQRDKTSSSLYSQENSIAEEEEDEVFGSSSSVQVLEVSSTVSDDGGELEIMSELDSDHQSINVTGRNSRRRRNKGQLVSLPSESSVKMVLEGNIEVERDAVALGEVCDDDAERRSDDKHSRREIYQNSSLESSCAFEDSDSVHSMVSKFSDVVLVLPEKSEELEIPVLEQTIGLDSVADLEVSNESSEDVDGYIDDSVEQQDEDSIVGPDVEMSGVEEFKFEEMNVKAVQDLTKSDALHADTTNASYNSGVVTFKTEISGSGLYDSFSDCTRDEFLQDTEIQEITGNIAEMADETDIKLTNVKRRIFDGESGMESNVHDEDSVGDPGSNIPFTLGRVSFETSATAFTLGSIDSELGDDEDNEPDVSGFCGDDSVFSRKSLGGNSTLSLSFDVPDDCREFTEDDVLEEEKNEVEVESLKIIETGINVCNTESVVPTVLVTEASIVCPSSNDESIASPEYIPPSPRLSYHTARSSSTDLSPMFDTTAEEMMLFEMFGESYDEQVEAMSVTEKIALKEMLGKRGDDEINLVAQNLHKIMQDKARESSIGSTVSPFSIPSSTPSFQLPPDVSPAQQESAHDHSEASPYQSFASCLSEQPEFRVPPSVTYHLPTTASLGRIVSKSPSPCKVSTPWIPPSPSPKFKAAVSPHRSRPPLSRLPIPVVTTPRQGSTPQQVTSTTPGSAKKYSRVNEMKAAAYAAVASPVAEYVKSNPAPPLVQNVRGKSAQRDLESTLVEVDDDKENMRRLSQLPPCPLPPANYQPGSVTEEQVVYETGPDYAYIPEAYGTINSSAKVTKHLARVKVGVTAEPVLKWNESCLVNDESLNSSPSVARYKAPVRSVLKQTRRDSGLFDESMMEMSVLKTKVVKKIARGRGGGRGSGRRK